MENYFIDGFRSDRGKMRELRAYLTHEVAGRRCIVMGSAPDPVVPPLGDSYAICVNGSVYSAYKYWSSPPDLTYLNGAIFNDRDAYSNATLQVLKGRNIGDALIALHTYDLAIGMLREIDVVMKKPFALSKYEKRLILGEALGYSAWGLYPFASNVSNGLFMSAVALWAGAPEVVLVGFSFNSRHAYSEKEELSTRGHIREDALCLDHVAKSGLPFFTTSAEINAGYGIRLLP